MIAIECGTCGCTLYTADQNTIGPCPDCGTDRGVMTVRSLTDSDRAIKVDCIDEARLTPEDIFSVIHPWFISSK